ncbi:MAG: SEC-C metal-binding domain-containing protein [Caldisericia bacterium]|nr:SEC-C metal-binding domain-containing protein [Caldisericia bacterium]
MTESKAQKMFEKYNPVEAVTRCPNGRSPVRKVLDHYAKAAVNLYGVISKKELASIFNSQNTEQTTPEEIFTLLLPLVLKQKWYCFYKHYIVHYWAIDNFAYADSWISAQGDKPRFIPEKDELLKFENEYYESEKQATCWNKLFDFILKEWPENYNSYRFYNELKRMTEFSSGIQEVSQLFEKYNFVFTGEKNAQAFFNLLMEARNNTRMWSNKGYSPYEMHALYESRSPQNEPRPMILQEKKKIGPNEPCPCGSGKKYKKCCYLTEKAKTAQLSKSECTLFYETWYGLMGFVNEREKVISASIKPVYPNPISDEEVYKVREVFWENPEMIDDYVNTTALSEEKIELLKTWRDHHKRGMFFLVDYTPEYAVILGVGENKEDRLYGIKGISRSLSDAMQREIPIQLETVLLPFKDKIIYDSYMTSMPISYGEGAKKALREMYERALKHGIITHWGNDM